MHIEGLEIEVRRSDRRKTVDLIVDRFGDLVINVPVALPLGEIEAIVHKKLEWIYAKLGQKEAVLKASGRREYVTGEGFYYLGRKYRLKLDPSDRVTIPPLRLRNGRFWLARSAVDNGRSHFIQWYTKHGEYWIPDAVETLKDRVAAQPKSITVRDLKYQWGSCSAVGDVYFHWRVMLLPPKVVNYLILHELVHLHEHNHSPEFYNRMSRAFSAYHEMEAWLEANGHRYDL